MTVHLSLPPGPGRPQASSEWVQDLGRCWETHLSLQLAENGTGFHRVAVVDSLRSLSGSWHLGLGLSVPVCPERAEGRGAHPVQESLPPKAGGDPAFRLAQIRTLTLFFNGVCSCAPAMPTLACRGWANTNLEVGGGGKRAAEPVPLGWPGQKAGLPGPGDVSGLERAGLKQ